MSPKRIAESLPLKEVTSIVTRLDCEQIISSNSSNGKALSSSLSIGNPRLLDMAPDNDSMVEAAFLNRLTGLASVSSNDICVYRKLI